MKTKLLIIVMIFAFFYSNLLFGQNSKQQDQLSCAVEVVPASAPLYEPVDLVIKIKNAGAKDVVFPSLYCFDIVLTLREGNKENVNIIKQVIPIDLLRGIIDLQPEKEWNTKIPLSELVVFCNPGKFVFSYKFNIELSNLGKNINQNMSGTFNVEVLQLTNEDLLLKTNTISLGLKAKNSRQKAFESLLLINAPQALPVFEEAWNVFADEDHRRAIIDAVLKNTDYDLGFKCLEKFLLSADYEMVQLYIISSVSRYRDNPDKLPMIRNIWLAGLSSKYDGIKIGSIYSLGEYCKPFPVVEVKVLLKDKSEAVRQAAEAALKKYAVETNPTIPSPSVSQSTEPAIPTGEKVTGQEEQKQGHLFFIILAGAALLVVIIVTYKYIKR